MAKIISISNEVYDKLKELKEEKSYTDVIKILLSKRTNKEEILNFAGKGGFKEKEFKFLKKEWKKMSKKYA